MSKKKTPKHKCVCCTQNLSKIVTGITSDGEAITFLECENNCCARYGLVTNVYR